MKKWTPSLEDIEMYETDGFLVVRRLLGEEEVSHYRQSVDSAVAKYLDGRSPNSTGYEKVFVQIHNARLFDSAFGELSLNPIIARIAAMLAQTSKIRVFLDQIIYKQPAADATLPHQDAPYLSFNDVRSLNCWIALDKAGADNGGLEYFAGSQQYGLTRLVHLDRKDDLLEEFSALKKYPRTPVEVEPGDVVFHNCYTVHCASPNRKDKPRRAFSIQYMPDGASFNGWMHPFLEPYRPEIGDILDFDCFPLVYSDSWKMR
jgi:ectoine hydroxylase-related dioxygenase (phytanoyl-CoA dioxygenase family)